MKWEVQVVQIWTVDSWTVGLNNQNVLKSGFMSGSLRENIAWFQPEPDMMASATIYITLRRKFVKRHVQNRPGALTKFNLKWS